MKRNNTTQNTKNIYSTNTQNLKKDFNYNVIKCTYNTEEHLPQIAQIQRNLKE